MEQTIISHPCNGSFTVIPNDLLQNPELSIFARGLLVFILSLPSNWEIRVAQIAAKFDESEHKILKALRELIELGYCKREPLRKDGRLHGQQYIITDTQNCFSAPVKNRGAEFGAAPSEIQPTENSAPQKNEGAIKEYNLFDKENIDEIEKERTRAKGTSEKKDILFVDSRYFEMDKFLAAFPQKEFAGIDLVYYYHAVADWSASKGAKRRDWIACARNIIRSDTEKNKLHRLTVGGTALSPDAIKYLQDMAD